jgi:galactokinase
LGCHCLRIGPGMWDVEPLPLLDFSSGVWILADSGDMKDTFGHLKRCKDDRLSLLEQIGGTWNENIPEGKLSDDQVQLLKATLTNRDTEADATKLWREALEDTSTGDAIGRKLGALMLRHHHALRDGLKLSTEKLDAIGEAAMTAGAWGYKLVGSGGGGCAVAWVPSHLASAVTEEMTKAGARNAWTIDTPSQGARIEL